MIHDASAERAVVGVVLNTRHGVGHVAAVLQPADFYVPTMGNLYAACVAMSDVVSLEDRIAFAVAFTDVPEARIRRLISQSPVMFNSEPWARRVADAARQRESCA